MKNSRYRFLFFSSWLLVSITIGIISIIISNGNYGIKYWLGICWIEFLNSIVWLSFYYYFSASLQSSFGKRIFGNSASAMLIISISTSIALTEMIIYFLLNEQYVSLKFHLIFQTLCLAIPILIVILLTISGQVVSDDENILSNNISKESLLALANSSFLAVNEGQHELKENLKKLCETIKYSLHSYVSNSKLEEYNEIYNDIVNINSLLLKNDHFENLSDEINKSIIYTISKIKILSSNSKRI
ncbi:hypothetical protein N5U36_04725 [Aliarcobacter butzleri]|jgi:hypothetical protein|uniref:hypothetical protein n=1 Tax=Aliarcobacter butzleri TaxID=28197 RepID=UPI0021B32F8F|nr:hypothetical protein [Aliarcobacter butzleri]MCT7634744.1 hypothetical protein [Aliarcobacter butzleri]